MPPISFPHYIQLTEDEEKVLQNCLKHSNAGIKKTVIMALKSYQSQVISAIEAEPNTDDLIEIKALLHDLNNHLEENNFLIRKHIET